MVAGDWYLFRGTNYQIGHPFNLAAAKEGNRLLPYWPDPALEVAQVYDFDGTVANGRRGRALLVDARHWDAVAASRDPRFPHIWTLLGGADAELKDYGVARDDYVHALSLDRWYTQAFEGLAALAGLEGNWAQAARWYRLSLETVVDDPTAALPLRGLLKGAEQKAQRQRR